jgi:hypothetical protein
MVHYGLQIEFRFDVVPVDSRFRNVGGLEGVSGRMKEVSGSARRINCNGVNGEPFVEGDDLTERGLA